jgi:hydroxymethylbilane synthase
MNKIRIGTRTSALAIWQANAVRDALQARGYDAVCVGIESTGDKDLTSPLYAMGITGVFTKELDSALLENKIDIAVHSLKDVPTEPANGLVLSAVLPRGPAEDVVVCKSGVDLQTPELKIATSSIRRKAQWLEKYPSHQILPVRGNIQTRLRKLEEQQDLAGMVFARAGLERLNQMSEHTFTLDWMLPAPAQGIIGILCRCSENKILAACQQINDASTYIVAEIERQFMYTLQGGCSVPVSCLTIIDDDFLVVRGALHSMDGQKAYRIEKRYPLTFAGEAGADAAHELLNVPGASKLIDEIRRII